MSERVAIIRRLLIARSWDSGRAEELAAEWSIAVVTVQAHAAEAQRQIEAMVDQEQVRASIDGLLLEAADRARKEKKNAEAAKALTAVAKVAADVAGLTRKHAAPTPTKGKEAPALPEGKPEPKPWELS